MNYFPYRQLPLMVLLVSILSACVMHSRPDIPQKVPWADYLEEVDRYQSMIDSTITYIELHGERFGVDTLDQFKMIDHQSKKDLIAASSRIMSYLAHLNYVRYVNQGHYYTFPGDINFESFVNYYCAFLVQSSRAVHFITIIERNKALGTILDEAYPEYGMEVNSYTKFKDRFLSPSEAVEFTRLQAIYREHRPEVNPYYMKIAMLEGYNLSQGLDYGVKLSFDHAQSSVEKEGFNWWFPIQKDFASWLGTMRLFEDTKRLISPLEIEAIQKELLPGDIFFQRREGNFTNAGIPGYWTHAALYVGAATERGHFEADDSVRSWVRSQGEESGSFEQLLTRIYPEAYAQNMLSDSTDKSQVVLESLSPGVIFQSLESSLACDGVGVLRPVMSNVELAYSIFQAFQYFGRNYDYNFDFLTDSTLVCSELVYKTFEPSDTFSGIPFTTENVAGRIVLPANKMVKQFDRNHGTMNLEFICFYDGVYSEGRAVPRGEKAFRDSWRRLGLYPILQSEAFMLSSDF